MLGAARLAQAPRSTGPVGQAFWIEQGTQNFVVPALVTSVCAVLIGGGGQIDNIDVEGDIVQAFGGGGGLVYINNLPVTPGETLEIFTPARAGSGGTARIRRAGVDLLRADGGERGDSSGLQFQTYWGAPGGSGAAAAGVTGAVIRTGGHGYDLGLRAGAAKYGGGAQGDSGTSLNGSGDTTNRLCGRQFIGSENEVSRSGVRIIWGSGRAFPNTNTGDM